jgi:hypothetical protein
MRCKVRPQRRKASGMACDRDRCRLPPFTPSAPREGRAPSRCRCGTGRAQVPVQMWHWVSPSPGADVALGEPKSRCRCGRGEPKSRCRCGRGEPKSRCRCGSDAPVHGQRRCVRQMGHGRLAVLACLRPRPSACAGRAETVCCARCSRHLRRETRPTRAASRQADRRATAAMPYALWCNNATMRRSTGAGGRYTAQRCALRGVRHAERAPAGRA